jgi:hypothetical protein
LVAYAQDYTTMGITPTAARQIDAKIDDGKPLTGQVMTGFLATLTPSCDSLTSPNTYNESEKRTVCSLFQKLK